MKNVVVLMGGTSSEREVSLKSGKAVAEALRSTGEWDVTEVVLDADNLDALPKNTSLVFIALHGGWGENGELQAELDKRKIKYTGPGSCASRVAMDKLETKKLIGLKEIASPPWQSVKRGETALPMPPPFVVKPPCDGSSVGITKVSTEDEWPEALAKARMLEPDGDILVEKYIAGREMTASVLDGKALPVVEIKARGGWYGYEEKYTKGLTEYVFPESPEDAAITERIQRIAEQVFKALNCRGVSRVDFRISEDGSPYVLEVNTLPGMTETSLLPKAAAKAGMDFPTLCSKILSLARYGE